MSTQTDEATEVAHLPERTPEAEAAPLTMEMAFGPDHVPIDKDTPATVQASLIADLAARLEHVTTWQVPEHHLDDVLAEELTRKHFVTERPNGDPLPMPVEVIGASAEQRYVHVRVKPKPDGDSVTWKYEIGSPVGCLTLTPTWAAREAKAVLKFLAARKYDREAIDRRSDRLAGQAVQVSMRDLVQKAEDDEKARWMDVVVWWLLAAEPEPEASLLGVLGEISLDVVVSLTSAVRYFGGSDLIYTAEELAELWGHADAVRELANFLPPDREGKRVHRWG
jgi:hypothetical protein